MVGTELAGEVYTHGNNKRVVVFTEKPDTEPTGGGSLKTQGVREYLIRVKCIASVKQCTWKQCFCEVLMC